MIALWQCKAKCPYLSSNLAYTFFKQISEDEQEYRSSGLNHRISFDQSDRENSNLIYIPKEE